jgi:putative (di)nucleoside polyphosphate hydrolase
MADKYRKCVGIMLVNNEGKIFVGKRVESKYDAWQMPQGGIDNGELPKNAAIRELYEETGIKSAEYVAETSDWLYYTLPENLASTMWDGKYKGQMQRWFLFRFTGDDSEVKLDIHEQEFSQYRWVAVNELEELAIYFKKEIYAKVVAEFKPFF